MGKFVRGRGFRPGKIWDNRGGRVRVREKEGGSTKEKSRMDLKKFERRIGRQNCDLE